MQQAAADTPIRVASIPYSQVYIRHLEPPRPGSGAVLRLPDPDPAGGGKFTQSVWWPPVMLSAGWVAEHHDEFDLMHIHFGFDAISAADLRELVDELRRRGKPLVYTAHDLRNPHHPDPGAHDAHLDILIPSADRVITLTHGAADAIRARWGVDAVVLPHPHVVDFPTLEKLQAGRRDPATGRVPPPSADRPFRVGVHLKSIRANMDPDIVDALADALAPLPHARLIVNVHRDVVEPGTKDHRPDLAARLRDGAGAGRWTLDAHDYFDEHRFFAYLASLDVSVLPYRFGTHSGWLEACRDVGTSVVAPSCGYYRDQHPSVVEFRHDEKGLDPASLRDAVARLYADRPWPAPTADERRAQRLELAAAHERIYADVLGGSTRRTVGAPRPTREIIP
ncbi:glycosyltransferase [Arthrobacter halodurans]|uniref:Glycosyltransferase n=1 Tax=Arthrobacter halodurans TaxID=516699 RepID=A0ABV4UKE8_9MICC